MCIHSRLGGAIHSTLAISRWLTIRAMLLPPEVQPRVLLDAVPDPTLIANDRGEIVFASARFHAVFGYVPQELVGQSVEVLLPERLRPAHKSHRARYFEHLQPRSMGIGLELQGLRKDGTEFPVEVSLSPVETPGGVLVLSAIRDITERRRAEHALAQSKRAEQILRDNEERLRWALMAAHGGAWDWDLQSGESWWSPEMYELWGVEPGTPMKLENSLAAVAPDDRSRLQRAVDEATESHADYRCEFRIRHFARGERWVASRGRLLYDEQGRAVRMLGITLDVTDRKHAEEALQRSNEELERLVRDRTIALEAARQEAERGSVSKSRFLAAASHDLRQPLQSVGLYLSVLTRQLAEPKQQEIAEKILVSLDTMRDLLDTLLDISKLESGSVEPMLSDFAVRQLLARIANSHAQQAEKKGLTLETLTTPCVLHSDPALLERVLDNLVANAIRYTERGRVTVSCKPCEGGCARISVADTGIGIPKAKFEDIFEEYYQIDNSIRDRSKGLGLGLAIVKHVARVLGHSLNVESVPGHGSTFSVDVPLGKHADAEHSEKPVQNAHPRTESPTVLLVEDDASIVDATTLLLEAAGMHVHSALNGQEALARLAAGAVPDVIVTDYRLPGGNGASVIRQVRQATGRDLPAILVTGDTSTLDAEAKALERCKVMHKPVDTDELLASIAQLAARPSGAAN